MSEIRVCDICGERLTLDEIEWVSPDLCYFVRDKENILYREHRTFDFCEECELQLTEAIINGRLKKYLWGK